MRPSHRRAWSRRVRRWRLPSWTLYCRRCGEVLIAGVCPSFEAAYERHARQFRTG